MKRLLAMVLTLALVLSASAQLFSSPAAAESGDAGYTPTQYGDSGDNVAAIQEQLKALVAQHAEFTGSPRAKAILADWDAYRGKFVKVYPNEYRRALKEMAAAQQEKEIA